METKEGFGMVTLKLNPGERGEGRGGERRKGKKRKRQEVEESSE